MLNLTNRQSILLNLLLDSEDSYSSEYLSNILGVSSKTVRNDFDDMKLILSKVDCGLTISSKTGAGFRIKVEDQKKFKKYRSYFQTEKKKSLHQMVVYLHRAHFIVRKLLLLQDNRYLRIDDLADELFTNRTTIAKDLHIAKEILKEFDLEVIRRQKYGLALSGREHDMRMCLLSEYTYYENSTLLVEEKEYQALTEVEDDCLDQIHQIIIESRSVYQPIEISLKSIQMIARLIIINYRREAEHPLEAYPSSILFELLGRNSFRIAKWIALKTNLIFHRFFSNDEVLLLTQALMGLRNNRNAKNILDKTNYFACYELAEEIVKTIAKRDNLKNAFYSNVLMENLTLHLITMRERIRAHIKFYHSSPEVRLISPFALEMAIQSAEYLQKTHSIKLDEEEIIYLSAILFYYFVVYENKIEKSNIIVVSDTNTSIGMLTYMRLMKYFKDWIASIKVADVYELSTMDLSNIDYIFTTESEETVRHYAHSDRIPIQFLNARFSQKMLPKIKSLLSFTESKRAYIHQVFDTALFYPHVDVKNKEECFLYMYQKMAEKFDVPYDFLENLFYRESLFSCEVGLSQARLSCTQSFFEKTFCAVFVLERPILWKYQNVQVVLLWSVGSLEAENEYIESGLLGSMIRDLLQDSQTTVRLLQNQTQECYHKLCDEALDSLT